MRLESIPRRGGGLRSLRRCRFPPAAASSRPRLRSPRRRSASTAIAAPLGSPIDITLQVRRRERREVRRRLPRDAPRRRRGRRVDVDRRSRSADADHAVETGPDRRIHAHDFRPGLSVRRRGHAADRHVFAEDTDAPALQGEDAGSARLPRRHVCSSSRKARTSSRCSRTAGIRPKSPSTTPVGPVAVDQEAGDAGVQEPAEGRDVLSDRRQPGRRVQREPAGDGEA